MVYGVGVRMHPSERHVKMDPDQLIGTLRECQIRLLRLRRFVGEIFHAEGSVMLIGLTTTVIALLLLRIAIFS